MKWLSMEPMKTLNHSVPSLVYPGHGHLVLRNLALDRSFDINSERSAFSVVLHSVLSIGKEKPMAVFLCFRQLFFKKSPLFTDSQRVISTPSF